jgi:hypothetical protein
MGDCCSDTNSGAASGSRAQLPRSPNLQDFVGKSIRSSALTILTAKSGNVWMSGSAENGPEGDSSNKIDNNMLNVRGRPAERRRQRSPSASPDGRSLDSRKRGGTPKPDTAVLQNLMAFNSVNPNLHDEQTMHAMPSTPL